MTWALCTILLWSEQRIW